MLAAAAIAALLAASTEAIHAQNAGESWDRASISPSVSAAKSGNNGAVNSSVRSSQQAGLPPRVVEAERFLARRGLTPGAARRWRAARSLERPTRLSQRPQAASLTSSVWLPLGPLAVKSLNFGLVTGRISALALDPSDATGNTLYVGTTGGGVWRSQNADTADPANIAFIPLTDSLPALSDVLDASISIGALAVQPDGTGVILAGTGDPNDALDSYYGAGILRSSDGGNSWILISTTFDGNYSFIGEGFAGFAWGAPVSSVQACGPNPASSSVVVAAVSQAYEGTLVDALRSGKSYEGLYYSTDSGANWCLATITDGSGQDIQGPNDSFVYPDGNAATSVVWNPVRQLFVAAVRYHGYYQSADGITWTRMAGQPGGGLMASSGLCPANPQATGSPGCPIFRGALAVNPETGDTFAWTVDIANQDQGIWQDECAASAGACASSTIWAASQTQQWGTAALETDTMQGTAMIANGDYNLALAAIPAGIGQQYGTIVLAGANDLWKADCPYSQGCAWRNTTNSTVGFCAQVGEYQHALAWNAANPMEILIGNDSGLWRSTDAIGETGEVCSPDDSTHFQNLNGSLGSLAEVVSLSQSTSTPGTMMAGLGVDGTAGVEAATGLAEWPEILGGEGGPAIIDPADDSNWFVNNQAGVSIYRCSQSAPCTPSDFGSSPVIDDADVGGDGLTMSWPAPFLVDPLTDSQLLVGTCRVWRGSADGAGWTAANAISPIFDGTAGATCNGDALINTMAAAALPSGGEVIYVGMSGAKAGGATLAGHVLSSLFNPASGSTPVWTDLTFNPVTNGTGAMNGYGLEISSIFIDPHDSTGATVYVTVAGIQNRPEMVQSVYGSTDGGAHWNSLVSNLPTTPANGILVDPQNAGTVYLATDMGVYSTQQISNCLSASPGCWSPFGSGLPEAPVVALSAAPASGGREDLVAATYGRGIWMAPFLGSGGEGTGPATDTLSPASLTFPGAVMVGQLSTPQIVTLTNSGGALLSSIAISVGGPFEQTNACTANLAPESSCAINVVYAPTAAGDQTGTLTVSDLLRTQTVPLSATGIAPPAIGVSAASLSFTGQQVGVASSPQTLTVTNIGGSPMANVGFQISGLSASSFSTSLNQCGAVLASGGSCTVQVIFTPASAGGAAASLVVSSSTSGVAAVTVPLEGAGQTAAGINVNPVELVFSIVAPGKNSPTETVTITNTGGSAVNSLTVTATQPFNLAPTANPCGATLDAGANCSQGVIFSPALAGSFSGALTVLSSGQTLATVPLSGVGGTPGSIEAQPGQIGACSAGSPAPNCFLQTSVGQTSAPVTITLTNPAEDVSLPGFVLTPPVGFALVNNTCPSTFAAGARCTVGVELQPTSAGAQSGSLTAGSSVLAVAASIPVSGMGFDYEVCFGSSVAPCTTTTSLTVASGQTAYGNLVIAPLGGSQGAFTLTCGPPPPNSTCSFNPSGESVTANSTGTEQVVVATGVSSSARLAHPPAWRAVSLACGLLIFPLALWKRRRALVPIALLAIGLGGVSSCTSSGGGLMHPPNSGLTPAGSYPVVITVSSGNLQHQITLTLTVD